MDVLARASWAGEFRRLTLRSATGTAQRAVPTLRAFDEGNFFGCELVESGADADVIASADLGV